jgi:D-arginine dehydrogenase
MERGFLIIGGGIAGISAAARLSATARVIVLEGEVRWRITPRGGRRHCTSRAMAPGGGGTVAGLGRFSAPLPGVLSPRGLMMVAGGRRARRSSATRRRWT